MGSGIIRCGLHTISWHCFRGTIEWGKEGTGGNPEKAVVVSRVKHISLNQGGHCGK